MPVKDADQKALQIIAGMLSENALGARHESGTYNIKFSAEFGRLYGARFATTLSSGSAALEAALHGVGVGPSDEVIVDPFLKFAPLASLRRRAVPVFADIDPGTLILSPEAVRRALTPRTRAVIVTALFGYPPDVEPFRAAVRNHNVKLIVDCAQALFSERDGRLTGPEFDCATFSFQASKHLSTGEGGMLVTNHEDIFARAIELKDFGWRPGIDPSLVREGWMYRMAEPIAAIGYARLADAAKTVERHRHIATVMHEELEGCKAVEFLDNKGNIRHAYWTWAVRIPDSFKIQQAEEILAQVPDGLEFGFCRAGLNFERPLFDVYEAHDPECRRRITEASCRRAKEAASRIVHVRINSLKNDAFFARKARELRQILESI